jgi:hypothetical protein
MNIYLCVVPTRLPQRFCNHDRLNPGVGPPAPLVAVSVQFSMVVTTEWHRVFITHFAAHGHRLGKFK